MFCLDCVKFLLRSCHRCLLILWFFPFSDIRAVLWFVFASSYLTPPPSPPPHTHTPFLVYLLPRVVTPPCISAPRHTDRTRAEEPSQRVGEGEARYPHSTAQGSYDEWHIWRTGKQTHVDQLMFLWSIIREFVHFRSELIKTVSIHNIWQKSTTM